MSGPVLLRPAVAVVLAAGLLAASPPAERTSIAGVISLKYNQQHALPVAGPAGPVLLLNQSTGTNRNTGKADYMAGADATTREIADLTQGNGSHQGYITFAKGGDTTVSRWQGKVVTTLGADRKPATQFEGTWTLASGTGKYDGISGKGTYKGRLVSPTELSVEWAGEMQLDRTASR